MRYSPILRALLCGFLGMTIALASFVTYARQTNVAATPVGSAARSPTRHASSSVSCFDASGHKASFVTVEPGVRLEVLDWGGRGEPLVLLTGLGDNAHVYDHFAYQFTQNFHVIGINASRFWAIQQADVGLRC